MSRTRTRTRPLQNCTAFPMRISHTNENLFTLKSSWGVCILYMLFMCNVHSHSMYMYYCIYSRMTFNAENDWTRIENDIYSRSKHRLTVRERAKRRRSNRRQSRKNRVNTYDTLRNAHIIGWCGGCWLIRTACIPQNGQLLYASNAAFAKTAQLNPISTNRLVGRHNKIVSFACREQQRKTTVCVKHSIDDLVTCSCSAHFLLYTQRYLFRLRVIKSNLMRTCGQHRLTRR